MTTRLETLIIPLVLCLAAPCLLTAAQEQPSAAEVIAKCASALGGKAAWDGVRTLEISGTQDSYGKLQPFVLRRMRPKLYRLDESEGIRPMTVVYDGERAWWKRQILDAARGDWELPAPEDYARIFRADAEFAMPCLSDQEEGLEIDFVGRRELDAEPFFQLEVTLADGSVESWYLDTETLLPAARVYRGAYMRVPVERRIFFSDYREVDGIVLPFLVEIESGNLYRTMTTERVEVNADIDPEVFSLPPTRGMEALQGLAGRWNVEIRSREAPVAPWQESTAVSEISRQYDGSLLEENISYLAAPDFPLSLRRFFSYDRFRKTYRIVTFDNFTSRLDVLEGELEDGQLTVSNMSTDTPWAVYGNTFHTRERLYDLAADSFKIVKDASLDAGATWFVEEELSYSRADED
jgi:Protein of unknown function (DUF1579)